MTRSCNKSLRVVTGLLGCGLLLASSRAATNPPPSSWPGAELFHDGRILQITVDLPSTSVASLGEQPREYVRAIVAEGGNSYSNVGVHLKGSASFRTVDDKPSLTLDFSKFSQGQKFHSLRKIHLNNSVEDPSYVNEIIGSETFRAAGVPTPRATRALVTINGRARGLYVLKEGFTEDFLACHFNHLSDQLYEPENGSDVDGRLKRNSVFATATNRQGLNALARAALAPERAERWSQLCATLDMDSFLTFMSLEIMLGHRDGYCLAKNNFRLYHDLDSGKMVFFPHGMDQLLGSADLPWRPNLGGLIARAVMETPEGSEKYRECFGSLLTNQFNVEAMASRVDQLVQELQPVLHRGEWAQIKDAAAIVKERIVQRKLSLVAQLNSPVAKPLEFATGAEPLRDWRATDPTNAKMEQAKSPDGVAALHIASAGETAASWRTTALLRRGRYRFEGRVKIASVQPLPYGVHHGAGLRIRGAKRQTESFTGDSSWRLLAIDFQVEPPAEEVEFICELRAQGGKAWFELASLRVLPTGDL
ncbi:MAG TPA: CotH kinase family protein [Verrucomicrobiae bacterium]|nr:CotH kinase family protein [Verrucomicrobiae bacterium]